MLVKDLIPWALTASAAALEEKLSPFVLLQRPAPKLYAQLSVRLKAGDTVSMSSTGRLGEEILSLMHGFEGLLVLPLLRLFEQGELTLGRSDPADLVIHEPSVSSRHAQLRWDPAAKRCLLKDLQSRNGTFLNARRVGEREVILDDGDALSFGDAPFLLLRALTLQDQVRSLHAQLKL